MQDDEIIFFARLFASLGFNKIRLTGGEPTVRANIVDLVQGISDTPGIRSISITTNGILLAQLASPLAKAGLDRVNISLDTLDPEKFHRLTRWGKLEDVWAGVHAAEQAGLSPIKINAVVVRGYNERDILEVARLTMQHPWQVRFIEMMPFAGATEFQLNQIVDWQEMHQQIENELGPLEVVGNGQLDGEARLYHLPGAVGDIGFISSVTKPFCATCNRARLTADGRLRLCLLREKEINLLAPLRDGASLAELRQLILDGIWEKPWGHGLEQGVIPLNRVMSEIGG
jgi:cyclic pyranopterin phosphate synthase